MAHVQSHDAPAACSAAIDPEKTMRRAIATILVILACVGPTSTKAPADLAAERERIAQVVSSCTGSFSCESSAP
jgi:transcriptional regulator GlxA family with amidase domain